MQSFSSPCHRHRACSRRRRRAKDQQCTAPIKFSEPVYGFARRCAFQRGPGVAGENLSHTSHDRLSKMENKNQERLAATDGRRIIFFLHICPKKPPSQLSFSVEQFFQKRTESFDVYLLMYKYRPVFLYPHAHTRHRHTHPIVIITVVISHHTEDICHDCMYKRNHSLSGLRPRYGKTFTDCL